MKLKILSILVLTLASSVAQQLANMDFENWTYEPLSRGFTKLNGPWNTNNSCVVLYPPDVPVMDTVCYTFATRVTDAKSGNYSLKLQTPPGLTGGTGGLSSWDVDFDTELFPFTFSPIKLTGYYKFNKGKKEDKAEVTVDFYDDQISTNKYGFTSFLKEANAWTKFTVDIYNIPPTTSIQYVFILFKHAVNDTEDPSLDTYLMIDNLAFEYSVSAVMDEAIKDGFRMSDGVIDITNMSYITKMTLYNINGVACGQVQDRFDTKSLTNGIYLVSFEQDGIIKNFKLAVTN
ncbi:MAG TPA: hypothetical protein VL947_01420 [Cytophagales bacterium]|nr:hypothetical protein [Cytophagales bacterium]